MGEEAKQEPPKAESKPEEKPEEEKKGEKSVEEKKDPKPPSPCVLFVDLHCVGCARKIEKCIMKLRGVERVLIDMAKKEVMIKGIVEPKAICNIITKKTKRLAKVISPLPEAEGEPVPEIVNSQVSEPVTVELNVNMHCEACAEQLKGKILKMRGVQTAVAELSTGKVIVTGNMDANKLVEYVYRRTKKLAKIIPQPEPELELEPEPEPEPETETEPGQKVEDKDTDEKPEEKKVENSEMKEEGGDDKNENKEEKSGEEGEEEEADREVDGDQNGMMLNIDEGSMKRMMYYYQPLYMVEHIPPPQLFSDENPNACCIS